MKKTHCPKHGEQGIGLVCKHIAVAENNGERAGFFWGDDTDTARPDAWCSQCERELVAFKGASSEQWFRNAEFKIFCAACWDEAKAYNLNEVDNSHSKSPSELAVMQNMKESRLKRSVWLGAFLAPLTTPILYVMFVMLFVPDTTPKHERSWEAALVALSLALIPASYLVSFVFGAPLIYILRRFEKFSFMWMVSLAAPLGIIAIICLFVVTMAFGAEVRWEGIEWHEIASFLSTGAVLGAVDAALFCLLADSCGCREWALKT